MNKSKTYFPAMTIALLFAVTVQAADNVSINVTGRVVASACSTVNGGKNTLDVDLGTNIGAADLATPGSGSAMKTFELPLTGCPSGTNNIKVTFSGTADTTTNSRWKNTAATPAANTSVELSAQGTGVILSNGSTLTTPVVDGAASFKLQARAYSSVGSATPGDISSVIVASIEYQ
ncbi:fimbrial protein [Enterobacter mori]|uniref:fimbrial protein n=1 Tax=Enterobacter mori TaxID=539813 RepID=UPI001B8D4935|nr:fimbrial protein [Enterobacter mori]MBS3045961.1 type 1 fimbrial protein [Enterobacter mori]